MAPLNTKFAKDVLKAVEPIALAAGGHCRLDPGVGDKHARLIVHWHGAERFTPVSSSPRAYDNAIKQKTADVRRLFRQMQDIAAVRGQP